MISKDQLKTEYTRIHQIQLYSKFLPLLLPLIMWKFEYFRVCSSENNIALAIMAYAITDLLIFIGDKSKKKKRNKRK